MFIALNIFFNFIFQFSILKNFREEWVEAIKMVAKRLSPDVEDVEMNISENESGITNFVDETEMMEDLCEKFSLQGTSISKSSGKRKVTLESFEFLKVLGKGTFGKVILCREKVPGKLYAIKILKKEVIIQKDEVAHTLTENRVLRNTHHPFLTVSVIYLFISTVTHTIFTSIFQCNYGEKKNKDDQYLIEKEHTCTVWKPLME